MVISSEGERLQDVWLRFFYLENELLKNRNITDIITEKAAAISHTKH